MIERSTKEWNGQHWELGFGILQRNEKNSWIFFDWNRSGIVLSHIQMGAILLSFFFFFFCSLMTWSRLIDNWETWDDREMYTMQKIPSPSCILRRCYHGFAGSVDSEFFFLLYLPVSHCWSFNLRPWERTNISSYISSYSSSQSRSPLLFLRFFRQPFLHFIFLCVDFVCCFCIFLSSCVFFLYTLEPSSSVWIELMVIDWTLKTLIKIIFKYIYNVVLFIFNIF